MMTGQFKPAKDRRKKEPVKRVVLSPDAKRAYEQLVQERDTRDRDYTRHLPPDKTR